MKSLALCVLLLACHSSKPAQSSRALLGRDFSEVVVNLEAQPAALDLLAVFTQRGFVLKEQSRDERGITLRVAGDRRTVEEALHPVLDTIGDASAALDGRTNDRDHGAVVVTYGSTFDARVEQLANGTSRIQLVGRTVRAGLELCTEDPDQRGPCSPKEGMAFEPAGEKEAEIIDEVFAELRLRGVVLWPERAPTVAEREQRKQCLQRRREHIALANRVENDRSRANILGTTPRCE
ncbi:MAG TPA: hypothetical protein VIU61_07635 [Kofleriaceae bacterium]